MKISEAIIKLTRIMRDHGDIDLCVDTEGAAFTCHVINITDINHVGNKKIVESIGNFAFISLDGEDMVYDWKPSK